MTIETKIDELIAALNANTAAQGGKAAAGTAASTAAKPGATAAKPAGKPAATKTEYVPRNSKAEAQALANRVKEEKGVPDIRAIIKSLGYEKLADISKPEDLDKLADAALEALGETAGDEGAGDEGGDI